MASVQSVCTVYVNSGEGVIGELQIEHEVIDVSTEGPKADVNWSFTDAVGHFHAHTLDDKHDRYPTLIARRRHVECDGSCGGTCDGEGYDVTQYFCLVCDELIEPGTVRGPHYATMPGRTTWTVMVQTFVPALGNEQFSVRIETERATYFGIAKVVLSESSFGHGRSSLRGISPLGRRKPEAVVSRG